jgi:hypothetical protein
MNPMVIQFFKWAAPYGVVFGLGFCAAWYVQGLRVQSAKQELVAHKQAATTQRQQEKDRTDKLQEDIANDWNENLLALRKCYESGRCGLRPSAGGMPSGGISAPAIRIDGTPGDDLPTPARIVRDCAEETLKLIQLQRWVEGVQQ